MLQVEREHYLHGYDDERRFLSYWHQINAVMQLHPRTLLEVGIGNGTVSTYLKSQGLNVTTVDINPELDPDVVCSVTSLPISDNAVDVVLCAEVLEHLPFSEFVPALTELQRVSKRGAVLSLPRWGISIELTFKLPLVRKKRLSFMLPRPTRHTFDGEHYWEIGKRDYPPSRVVATVKQLFDRVDCYQVPGNPYHTIFICVITTVEKNI